MGLNYQAKQQNIKFTIHVKHWWHQGMRSRIEIFRDIVHLETSDDRVQGVVAKQ